MEIREDLKYTESHEWIRVEGGKAYVGITASACEQLGDIVYIELPDQGEVSRNDEVCTIESVKAASAVYSPVSGLICGVNENLSVRPEVISGAPYDEYIFVVEMSDPSELDALLDAAAYKALLG